MQFVPTRHMIPWRCINFNITLVWRCMYAGYVLVCETMRLNNIKLVKAHFVKIQFVPVKIVHSVLTALMVLVFEILPVLL